MFYRVKCLKLVLLLLVFNLLLMLFNIVFALQSSAGR